MKRKWNKVLATLMAISIGMGASNMEVLADETPAVLPINTVTVSGNDVDTENSGKTWDNTVTEAVYEGDYYKVTFSLTGFWDGGYNADIVIENIGERKIEDWYLQFAYTDTISNIWNAEVYQNENGILVIKNMGWNQDILAGQSVRFGISSTNNFSGFPEAYELIGEHAETSKDDYSIDYYVESDWGDGFTGSIVMTNLGDKVLEDWVLEFDFAREITNIWNGTIVSYENNHYTIRNADYNANILAGQSISFGFNGKSGSVSDVPYNFSLYSYELYNGDSMELDTDGDGIVDGNETLWGLNYKKADTDDDGLTDFEELFITLTNPLEPDTDGNGISDAEDDNDGDGIDNRTEIAYGTDPLSADTDGDNLTDYEEIYIYHTDPLNADTDGDGLSDYDDVFLGFSPLLQDTDGNGILDPDEKLDQTVEKEFGDEDGRGITKVSVSMNVAGNAQTKVGIINTYGMDALSSDVVGLVGVPVEIRANVVFDTAEISFYYDETALGDVAEEDLAILWYDEANNWYQILDQDCVVDTDNNKVSYVTTHFSTYMLVDSKAWYDAWRQNIDYRNSEEGDEKHYFDIAFVVDVSGSMYGSRISSAQEAMNNFIGSMQIEDEAAIVRFESRAYVVCDFTSDTFALKAGVSSLRASGGTNVNNGLLKALELFAARDSGKKKIIILLCDGDVNYVQSTIDDCIDQEIQIYAVNIASKSAHADLEKMADQTGGQYYYGESEDWLKKVFVSIQGDTLDQIDPTDTDGDGLYDIYETAGMKLPNGQIIYTDPNKADTDGDSLSDFEETGLVYNVDDRYIGFNEKVKCKYFMMRSNPNDPDTDDDGMKDNEDPHPWDKEWECVAELDNRFAGVDFLKIELEDNSFADGGWQYWWESRTSRKDKYNYWDFFLDKDYRIWKAGCGVIAMCDAEIYLIQQNEGYQPFFSEYIDIPYDSKTGIIQKSDYMAYVDFSFEYSYPIGGNYLEYQTGLLPINMIWGMHDLLTINNHHKTKVTWAPYNDMSKKQQTTMVLDEIETMLEDNLPVVFAYHSFDENNKIEMYHHFENARNMNIQGDSDHNEALSHYMTIIGLYKYLNEDSLDYEYLLEVASWGTKYYIRYDEYSDSLNYFSNILSINYGANL